MTNKTSSFCPRPPGLLMSSRFGFLRRRLYLESSYDPNAIALGGALSAPQGGGCTNISAIVNARTYRTTGNLGEEGPTRTRAQ